MLLLRLRGPPGEQLPLAQMMALLLNPRIWIALALAALLASTHFFAYRTGRAAVRVEFDAYKIEQAQLTRTAEAAARAREQSLQEQANQIEETKNEELRIVGDQLDFALASLRDRPARPAGNVPKAAGNCKGATGASLSRSDAEFLVRESARADRLRSALEACYAQYEALRR